MFAICKVIWDSWTLKKTGIHEHLKDNLQFENLVLKYDNFCRAVDGNSKR
jgi:hypothetical protein